MPVVAFAFLMIFERFIFQFLTTLPPGITEDLLPGLRPAGVRDHRGVLGRDSAGSVAHEFDLLWARGRERLAERSSMRR